MPGCARLAMFLVGCASSSCARRCDASFVHVDVDAPTQPPEPPCTHRSVRSARVLVGLSVGLSICPSGVVAYLIVVPSMTVRL